MLTQLERFLGIKIDRAEYATPIYIRNKLLEKYPYLRQRPDLVDFFHLIPFFLLSSQEMDFNAKMLRITLIDHLLATNSSLDQSELKDNLVVISPYIYFEFLVDFLKPETAIALGKKDITSDEYIQKILLELKKTQPIELDDKFLSNKVYPHLTKIVADIKSVGNFRLYANLISSLIEHCAQGKEILTFLFNEIQNKYQQHFSPLKDIIVTLERSKAVSDNPEYREFLKQTKKEIDFAGTKIDAKIDAKIDELQLYKAVEILDIYSTNLYYPIIKMRYHNADKITKYLQKRILENNFSAEELTLLKQQLEKINFLNLFVQILDKPTIDRFCEHLHQEHIIQSIKNSQNYRLKNQSGRISIIVGIDEKDLAKTGEDFVDISEIINEKPIDDAHKAFLGSLAVLSSHHYFENLSKQKQVTHIKSLVESFEDISPKNDDVIAISVHCMVRGCLYLLTHQIGIENKELLSDLAYNLNYHPQILVRIIADGELQNLQQEIGHIYKKILAQINNPSNVKQFSEQLLIINILDQENLFEDFVKELLIKHQHQLPQLIEIITSIKQNVVRIVRLAQQTLEILFKENHQELLDETIKECQLYHAINSNKLTPLTAVSNFRELSKITPFAPVNLFDSSFAKIKVFLVRLILKMHNLE